MPNKRLWITLMAIPISLACLLIIGSQRSYPASAGGAIDPTCTISSSPCIQYTNKSSGAGIEGLSLLGNGLFGITKFKSTSASNGKAGIFGNDQSTSGTFDAGVRGLSVRGIGVAGQSTGGVGIQGQTNGSAFGAAVLALSASPGDFLFRGQSPPGTDQFNVSTAGNVFVNGSIYDNGFLSANGFLNANGGVTGIANFSGGDGVFGAGAFAGVYASNFYNAPNSAAFYAEGHGGKLYVGKSSGGGPVFEVDDAGNVVAHSFTAGFAAAQRTASGTKVMTYATESRLPILEDFGEAQLIAGSAYVRIDLSFRSLMLPGSTYAVFVTPLGPVRGTLYISQKSLSGFTVRETAPGTSTVGFDYRIVGRRYVPPAPPNLDLRVPKVRVPPKPHFTN